MHLTTLLTLNGLSLLTSAAPSPQATPTPGPQSSYIETFSDPNDDTTPATIPGFDRALEWFSLTPRYGDFEVQGGNICDGVRSNGEYYGVFSSETPAGISADYEGNDIWYWDAKNFSFGCGANEDLFDPQTQMMVNRFVPANCSVEVVGSAQTGTVASMMFYYTTPEACTPDSIEQNYANLVAYELPDDFSQLRELTFTVTAVPNKVTGNVTGYLDDIGYVVTLSPFV